MSDAEDLLGSFVWYDQMSNDLSGSERFYEKVVGWTLAPNTMNAAPYTLLNATGNGNCRAHADPPARGGRAAGVDGLCRR